MRLAPFDEVSANAYAKSKQGFFIYQQWLCAHCKTKQTMPDANVFYTRGICEECKQETDIKKDGCNFMAVIGGDLADIIDKMGA